MRQSESQEAVEACDLVDAANVAFDSIEKANKVDVASLAPILEAARDSRVVVRDAVSGFLASLSVDSEIVRDAIVGMSRSAKWHIRFNSLLCLTASAPQKYQKDIVLRLIGDRSVRVREMAASKAFELNLRSLVFDLRRAAQDEENRNVLSGLEFSIGMLADGYVLRTLSDGQIWVTVPTDNGCIGSGYSRDAIERRGIQAIVKEVRAQAI